MNAKTSTESRTDEIISAIGVLAFMISVATGNALAMLLISLVALVVIAVAYRARVGRIAWLACGAAMVFAFAVAVAIATT